MTRSFQIFTTIFLTAIFVLSSCSDDPQTTTEPVVETPKKNIKVPRFDRDSAYQFIAKQVAFGPRLMETKGHTQTKEWLVNTFKSFGAEVIEQDFVANIYDGRKLNSTNIIAQFNPDAKKRIVLSAHWDTRHIADSPLAKEKQDEPILGADDGGSGVGVLLEVARQIQLNPIDMGVDIVLFDAEDHGAPRSYEESTGENTTNSWCLGAQHWASNLHRPNYKPKYGILLDMVGTKNAYFPKEEVSRAYAAPILNKVWKLAQGMGYGNHFVNQQTSGVTDDHLFVNQIAGIPMIDIINKPPGSQTGFGGHWHTHNDNMDIIDKRTLRAVGQVILAVVYREDGGKF